MMDVQADSAGSPCLSMPATASRSPWEHHWASTSVEGGGKKNQELCDQQNLLMSQLKTGFFTF